MSSQITSINRTKYNKNNKNNKNTTKRNNMAQEITLDTLYKYMVHEFKEIKQDISGLKKDVSELKKDVSELKKDVSMLKDDMRGVKKYIKLESKFQEQQNREFISKMYIYNHPSNIITTLHIQKIYTCTNKEITDIDGFLFISTFPIYAIHPSKDVVERIQNKDAATSFLSSLKNNNTRNSRQNVMEYIIIESKHSLSKGKVDKKIKQINEIYEMLDIAYDISIDKTKQCFSLYTTMINELQQSTGQTIQNLHLPINLIFSSDDISHELCNYIHAIHNGISEEEYNMFSLKLLYSDEYAYEIIQDIYKDGSIPKQIKHLLYQKESIISIRKAFATIYTNYEKYQSKIIYLQDYVTPYNELESLFLLMKGRIGVSQFNTILFPRLFTKQTFNQ